MVYSWGLFWPRELGVLNQRRISPSFYGPRGGKTGRQANEITDLDRIITSLKEREREREETISLTCSASPIRPSDHHHLIFSAASSVYMRPRGGDVCVGVALLPHAYMHAYLQTAAANDATHLKKTGVGCEAVSAVRHWESTVAVCVREGGRS